MLNDRRSGKRLVFNESTPFRLNATIDGEAIKARIVDISERGLTIAVDRLDREPPAGTLLNDAVLGTEGDGAGIPLAKLSVVRWQAAKGHWVVTLVSQDKQTEATLWHIMLRLRREGELHEAITPLPERMPRIPVRGVYTEPARLERLQWLRKESGTLLAPLQETRLSAEKLTGNIENLIGAIEVPVGIAGPLLIHGHAAKGLFYSPLATTEGALVASTSRGAAALTRSGGVTTRVIKQQMMRVPLFVLTSLKGTFVFANWIRDHVDELRRQVRKVSQHAQLVSVEPVIMGNMVHVHFLYETGDAAGQNMTTTCTWQASQWLMQEMRYFDEVEFENFIIEGAMSGDKKVNYNSFITGRGVRVVAEGILTREVLHRYLDVTPEQLIFLQSGAMAGSIQIGTMGYNINVANVIAGMFTATGQDIACVHESALGLFTMQPADDGLYVSMVLPSLVIGTVGGGTHLPGQHALLEMMGCAGRGKVQRLAEIIAGFCLSLDISTASAIASGQFASAHEQLGRNRPVQWFAREDLNPEFFAVGLRRAFSDPTIQVETIEAIEFNMGLSIMTELSVRKLKKLVGLFPFRLRYSGDAVGKGRSLEVFVKSKPLDQEAMMIMNGMALIASARLAAAWRKLHIGTEFAGCHVRELGIMELTDPRLVRHMPRVYRTLRDDAREAYVAVMERLTDMECMDAILNPRAWTRETIEAALKGVAEIHSIWYGRPDDLMAQTWLGPSPSAASMTQMRELWEATAVYAAEELPNLVTPQLLERELAFIASIPEWWPRLEAMPRTLIHNDFNPRNVAFRRIDGELNLYAYDWELATLHVPQHDLAELLCFVLSPEASPVDVDKYIEVHRAALAKAAGVDIDPETWRDGYSLSLRDFMINRLGFYMVSHTFRHYGFMERVFRTLCRLLELETQRDQERGL